MKLLIRQYLASLKERGELDAILPDLLSESGFHVYSRPQRGTTQHGVDVAAYGKDEADGEEKVFLFSVKSGDLTRQDWDNDTPQSLRASLNTIRDAYIPTRIPIEYAERKIVICLCFGGDLQEQLQDSVRGYTRQNQTERISYQEWNGERLAGLLLRGILREDVLPKSNRSNFQKAVAMVDSPDVAYRYFADLTKQLIERSTESETKQLSAARQLFICLWILFVWAREANNVEAPYRASELVVLKVWNICRPLIGKKGKHPAAMFLLFHQTIELHHTISFYLLDQKVIPHTSTLDGLSSAVATGKSVDVNQALFELLGRLAMAGIWVHWFSERVEQQHQQKIREQLSALNASAFRMIANNSTLYLPISDVQSIDIALVLLLAVFSNGNRQDVLTWLERMVDRLDFALRTHGKYTSVFREYRLLIDHPRSRTDEYRKDATSGSTLIPLLAAWLGALGSSEAVKTLVQLKQGILSHCTLQLWLPDTDSEGLIYGGSDDHGLSLSDLPIDLQFDQYMEIIHVACRSKTAFEGLSAITTNYWPIVLMACRHHRLPVPPQFWVKLLWTEDDQETSSETART